MKHLFLNTRSSHKSPLLWSHSQLKNSTRFFFFFFLYFINFFSYLNFFLQNFWHFHKKWCESNFSTIYTNSKKYQMLLQQYFYLFIFLSKYFGPYSLPYFILKSWSIGIIECWKLTIIIKSAIFFKKTSKKFWFYCI